MRTCALVRVPCYTSRMSRAIILSLSLLLACNFCNDDVLSEFAAEVCEPETSAGESSSTTYDGDVCEVQPGEVWGPCLPGFACAGVDVFCMTGAAGAICTPACVGGGQCNVSSCMPGACLTNGVCAPTCESDADCSLAGTVCDKSLPFPFCVFPS